MLFTNDLRLEDNIVLSSAASKAEMLMPIYFYNSNLFKWTELWIRKIDKFRAKFICESIENLRNNLESHGSFLDILIWNKTDDIVSYCVENNISFLYVQESVGAYERKFLDTLSKNLAIKNISLVRVWNHTLVHKDDLPFDISEMPQVFTNFRKQVEKESEIMQSLKIPALKNIESRISSGKLTLQDFWYDNFIKDSRSAVPYEGWESEALKRLQAYLWDKKLLGNYKNTRNWLIWLDYSSKFSPFLSLWCISPRTIYHEVKKYEREIEKNSSTYWLIFELLWRDFFQFIFLQDSHRFFRQYPISSKEILKTSSQERKFEKWKTGTTWVKFIDANMRELALTWFMSNRGRQNVSSYLVHDLKIDWRLWAMHFESLLIDYDVASNWWNWAYVAWIWNDPRDNRYFNIEKQASVYDPEWKYRSLWDK